MNAMQQAMSNGIPSNTHFPIFKQEVQQVSVKTKPHIIIPIRSNGDGVIIKGKKVTREVTEVLSSPADGQFLVKDICGEVWKAERITNFVYHARS